MNFKLFLCIAMGVFVAHLGVFMLIGHLRPHVSTRIPEPNFKVRSQTVVDSDTGEKVTYREITVSTHFAPPAPAPYVDPAPRVDAEPHLDPNPSAAR